MRDQPARYLGVLPFILLAAIVCIATHFANAQQVGTITQIAPQTVSPPLEHPTSESAAKRLLFDLGCSPPWSTRAANFLSQPLIFLPLVILLLVVAFWVGMKLAKRSLQVDFGNVAVAVGLLVTGIALVFTTWQWRASIEQEAMKKYETEIAAANVIEKSPAVRSMMAPLYPIHAVDDYERIQYVYLELDNLEYALERYTQGFSSAYNTSRAVMTFASRCKSPDFRARAFQQVRLASYSPIVVRVVTEVLKHRPA
jgi:hypothetical protein